MMIGQQVPVDLYNNIANTQLRVQPQSKTYTRLATMNRSTLASIGGNCSYQPSWRQQVGPSVPLPISSLGTSFGALVAQVEHLSPQLAIPPRF